MKIVTGVLVVYCIIIFGVAILDTAADSSRQPLTNLATIAAMSSTLFGILFKRRELILAIPIYTIFSVGVAAAETHNFASTLGHLTGAVVPISLALILFNNMKASQTGGSSAIDSQQK